MRSSSVQDIALSCCIWTDEPGAIPSRVYTVEPTGDVTYVHVFLGNAIIIASVAPNVRLWPDETVWIEFDQERLHLFDG